MAQQTDITELCEAVRAILNCVDPEGYGLFDGACDVAGARPTNGEVVLKGSFIERCIRLKAAHERICGEVA